MLTSLISHSPSIEASAPKDSGLILKKSATLDPEERTVSFELEAFQKGSYIYEEEQQPLDIILVLDQSSSMKSTLSPGMERIFEEDYHKKTYSQLYSEIGRQSAYFINDDSVFEKISISRVDILNRAVYTIKSESGEIIDEGNASDNLSRFYYFKSSRRITRLAALKTSVDLFLNGIKKDSPNHRVAFVGYAGGNNEGTQLLGTSKSSDTILYKDITKDNYASSLISIENEEIIYKVSNNISTGSGTATYYGFDMARKIIDETKTPERKQVVVLMTDGRTNGEPYNESRNGYYYFPETGKYPQSIRNHAANEALRQAQLIKDRDVDIYSIGLHQDANTKLMGIGDRDINTFLHYASSNFYEEQPLYMMDNQTMYNNRKPSLRTPPAESKYYFTSNDADSLNNVFETIKNDVLQPPEIKLGKETILKDTLTIPFDNIRRETVRIEKVKYLGDNKWNSTGEDITDQVEMYYNDNDTSIEISGFDYTENLIADKLNDNEAQGYKIVLKFEAKLRDGFIGGEKVETNGSDSGIYKKKTDKPLETFDVPSIDVDLNFSLDNKNHAIYLSNEFEISDIVNAHGDGNGFMYEINGEKYTLDGANNSHVDIKLTVADSSGNILWTKTIKAGESFNKADFDSEIRSNFKDTTSFKLNYEVATIHEPTKKLDDSSSSNVYVIKPKVNVEDTESYLGEAMRLDSNYNGNVEWISPNDNVNQLKPDTKYKKPKVTLSVDDYEFETDYYFEETTGFDYTVLLDGDDDYHQYVSKNQETFKHKIKTLKIRVRKIIKGRAKDSDNFKFSVKWLGINGEFPFKEDRYNLDLTIKGNESYIISGLPIGNYEIFEDLDWSWRYEVEGESNQKLELKSINEEIEITFTNKLKDKKPIGTEVIKENYYE